MKREGGATLLEALIAVLIFSFGILAVLGMQGVAIRTVTDAKYRADASFLANQVLARAWGNPANLSALVETQTPIADLPQGKRTVSVEGRRVTVTIAWRIPGTEDEHEFTVVGVIGTND
ncbi:MAG: hypothetical protein N2441_00765 [Rhodocyclaceae bacterium]|nr:hypothetical protein [Rhodocyclaceae bacterium]